MGAGNACEAWRLVGAMSTGWVDAVKATITIDRAITALGLQMYRMQSFGPCPLCRVDRRGDKDARGAAGFGKDGKNKWHCWRCSGGGDVVDLVAAQKIGKTTSGIAATEWAEVKAECIRLGWCDDTDRTQHASAARPRRGAALAAARLLASRRLLPGSGREREPSGNSGEFKPQPESEHRDGGRFGWSDDLAEQCEALLWSDAGASVLAYLREGRRLSDSTIRAWRLGAFAIRESGTVREYWATIPLVDSRDDVVNVRFRSVPGVCLYCGGAGCGKCEDRKGNPTGKVQKAYRVCNGRPLPLYGIARMSNDTDSAPIIVEGELDVVALYEYGLTTNVVSGTAGAGALKDEWLDQLEPYSSFIIAYDTDEAGDKGADQLAAKLGRHRCSRAKLPKKDAGDCLQAGIAAAVVLAAIDNAQSSVGVGMYKASHYKSQIERLVSAPAELVGRPTGSAKLDAALGGIRSGLIVITGETSDGKTTAATWLIAQQARMGVPSLLTSFEQAPIGTVQKLLRAQLGGDFVHRTEQERSDALDAIDAQPLWIVDHRGSMSFEDLLNTIRYAVRRRGVRNVLIDHLGFVVDPDAEDERKEIQTIVRALSLLAEHENVAIFLICHPSNTYVIQKRRVSLADLKGASAIRQDAHEVWVIEKAPQTEKRPWYASYFHLDKIRSDFGASGASVLLAFDPLATCYADSWADTPSGRKGIQPVVPSSKSKDAREPGATPRGRRKPKPTKDYTEAQTTMDPTDPGF